MRVQAIRGLPLFSKDTPEFVSKIIDVLVQCLNTGKCENFCYITMIDLVSFHCLTWSYMIQIEELVERDAVHKAFMSLFRQDTKGNLLSSAFIFIV